MPDFLIVNGMTMGTPAYMAPEQARGVEVDGRADLYALGAVLYEMVTGRQPFERGCYRDTMMAHICGELVPPSRHRTLPEKLELVIQRAMGKRPEARYQSGAEMAAGLREVWGGGQEETEERQEAPRPVVERVLSWLRK